MSDKIDDTQPHIK